MSMKMLLKSRDAAQVQYGRKAKNSAVPNNFSRNEKYLRLHHFPEWVYPEKEFRKHILYKEPYPVPQKQRF